MEERTELFSFFAPGGGLAMVFDGDSPEDRRDDHQRTHAHRNPGLSHVCAKAAAGRQAEAVSGGTYLEAQYEGEGIVEHSQILCIQTARRTPEPLGVDDRALLDEHSGGDPVERDRRSKARRSRPRRRR